MNIYNQALIKLSLNMPSLAGKLLATELGQQSNLQEAFKLIRDSEEASLTTSFSYKPSPHNPYALNILSVSATQIEVPNILGGNEQASIYLTDADAHPTQFYKLRVKPTADQFSYFGASIQPRLL